MLVRKRQVHSCRERERKDKGGGVEGGGGGRAGPSVAVASLSSSGGFPESPAVLNKGQSSTRQCSKTCYFSPLPSNSELEF